MIESHSPKMRGLVKRIIGRSRRIHQSMGRAVGQDTRDGLVAIADQALVSGVNFATALILARFLAPDTYGQYVLLFAVLLFVNGIQSAIIVSPMLVLAPRYEPAARDQYIASLWVIQIIGGILAIAGLALAFAGLGRWMADVASLTVLPPLLLMVFAYLLQEFVRRVLFAERDKVGGFIIDLISYGLQLAVILILIALQSMSLDLVLWTIALTSLAASFYGLMRRWPAFNKVSRASIVSAWRDHWDQGRWLVSGTLAQWGSTQLYFFVAAALLSPFATGLLAASRNLLGFSHIFMLALENFVPASLTRRLMQGGVDAMERWMARFRLLGGIVMGSYCLSVAIFADPLMKFLFGPEYGNTQVVVILVAISYFVWFLGRSPAFGLRALTRPRWLFYSFAAASGLTVVVSAPLVYYLGLNGAAIGMIGTQIVLLAIASVGYRRESRAYQPGGNNNAS